MIIEVILQYANVKIITLKMKINNVFNVHFNVQAVKVLKKIALNVKEIGFDYLNASAEKGIMMILRVTNARNVMNPVKPAINFNVLLVWLIE